MSLLLKISQNKDFPLSFGYFFSAADAVLIYLRAHTSGNP